MALALELPFATEYAKSGRASCKLCREAILKDSIRLAIMVRSPFFDGRTPNWHHFDCFFRRARPNGVEEIKDYEHLRFEDQKRVESAIEKALKGGGTQGGDGDSDSGRKAKKAGKKRSHQEAEVLPDAVKDFKVEYAKSNRSECKLCKEKVLKEQIRIGRIDRESKASFMSSVPIYRWFHMECFANGRDELGWKWAAAALDGFEDLKKSEQKLLKKKLPPTMDTVKVAKVEASTSGVKEKELKDEPGPNPPSVVSKEEEAILKKQSKAMFGYIDQLKKLRNVELQDIFYENGIKKMPSSISHKLEYIADALAFGKPQQCPQCNEYLYFKVSKYICAGSSQWSKCAFSTEEPERLRLVIPEKLAKSYDFLANYKYKPGKRIGNSKHKAAFEAKLNQELQQYVSVKKDESDEIQMTELDKPLKGYNLACMKELKSKVMELGAQYVTDVDRTTLCVVGTEAEAEKKIKRKKWKVLGELCIPVVSEEFLTAASNNTPILQAIKDNQINLWNQTDAQLEKRIENLNVAKSLVSGRSAFRGSKGTCKLIVKSGAVVDPASKLEHEAHILKVGDTLYTSVLNYVDLSSNNNSYYKIQVLEHDSVRGRYWVFKSWGRIGTDIGRSLTTRSSSKEDAISEFKRLYKEKTANDWEHRDEFVKHPNFYYPVEVDYGEKSEEIDVQQSTSTLPMAVKHLIQLIFDVKAMRQAMLEFELDLEKMPLGKLSKTRMLEACSVLKEISTIIEISPPPLEQLQAACNQFYSLVPHSFGLERPPLIMDSKVISAKNQMLEDLMQIELAYEIIQTKSMTEDPIDHHYLKLNASIEPIEPDAEEYKLIEKYLTSTHGATHSGYTLDIVHIFKVTREEDVHRFEKFKNNDNRMLLWHGSRITNFVGILSHGLKIAPPEAPVNGYMFGKGIYFADAVSKSANYCCASQDNPLGLLILSEVAIGKSMELKNAKNVIKLEKPYLSVKGLGGSYPDPAKMLTLDDGVKVPLGPMVSNPDTTYLLYNEYIVYNESQVRMRYLVNAHFSYKSLF